MRRPAATLAAAVAVATLAVTAAAPASAANLRAGAGRADITPKTGYYLGGWTRADRTAHGQLTRLFARTIVLERGGKKVALVSIDLFMVPGGLRKEIGDGLASRGLSEQNIVVSASHTHSGPGGYANFPTLNTAAPSLQTATDPVTYFNFFNPKRADPELYRFLYEQISKSIVRADDNLGPAEAGWGSDKILGLTANRSLEAHLADHGIILPRGEGTVAMDPQGYEHTVDPSIDVLRVDKVVRRGRARVRIPIGAWSNFADHGTVTKSTFQYYNGDHHGSATRVFETGLRKAGKVPARQDIVNVYGNSDEGDMSAGLTRDGPAAADYVGRVEAAAMLRAWKRAGSALTATPALDTRWTRMCFCGQMTEGGNVDDHSQLGIPFLTGSEEERGPLFDVTHQHYEGQTSPFSHGPQGQKLFLEGIGTGGVPNKVPLVAVRIGPRVMVTIPGEATKEVGTRIRAAVAASVAGSGIDGVVLSGLANEFVLYFTTPEEYDRQHYEGGNTHFGRVSANLVQQELAALAGHLARGEPAQPAADFDPTNGVVPDGPAYGDGADSGTLIAGPQARPFGRLDRVTLSWQGGPQGLDRPVDKPFITAERRVGSRWARIDDDLGMAMLWKVDDTGRYDSQWEIPRDVPLGTYRMVVTAKRYRLVSPEFIVEGAATLKVSEIQAAPGRIAVALEYPEAIRDVDLTARPKRAIGGVVRFRVGNRTVRVRRRGSTFSVPAPAGVPVSIAQGAARDVYGNFNGASAKLR
ncbi:MAG: neutral ceramidase [Thermoleophilales bacterium]|nr:neutral ceramidase [Thermoleophilales bacterium]